MKCDRCAKETHWLEQCFYCNRRVCRSCEKSTKVIKKRERKIICKDCWGKMDKRRDFKSA
ncbi:MAG: hypothetical protein HZB67_06115 [Candidatus Aenigmarchaeota archaeon]|nr:hypothetical protein [Candidatus Aenigmarchaeota archaeon]MBI5228907.1 hypothetical protein [Candidatus Micrarchaeota archaeon]